jgi:hypothetical protein
VFAIATIGDWVPEPGSVTCWHASPKARAAAQHAPVSAVPPSYQQAQHLRRFADHAARGLDMSRLMIFTWDLPGRCDVRALTYVLNAHLRRHDTYRSWFEFRDADHIIRHTIENPMDIAVTPNRHGALGAAELRAHILETPDPREWDGFRFGVIQRQDHFTFYASIAHLYIDPMIMGVLFAEIHAMYGTLVGGGAPVSLPAAGSYEEYCVEQREYAAALSAESPEVRAWCEFAQRNDGSFPDFPLALGDLSVPCDGDTMTATLLDRQQTERFESACVAGGARFSGGVFACAAIAKQHLTGSDEFHVITPTDTRKTPTELVTTGWFTGLVPVSVRIGGTFGDTARTAQTSFDSNTDMARVPFERVIRLATPEQGICSPRPGNFVMSFLDASIAPLSTVASSDLNFRIYNEGRASHQVSMWITRLQHETVVTVLFPSNPIARESVATYIDTMQSVYARAADRRRSLIYAQNVPV